MPCYHPIPAWRDDDGTVVFRETRHTHSSLFLACGQCVGCRLARATEWSVRIMHEASLHDVNSFVTLTYDDAHLPRYGSLQYKPDFQLFMKRFRKWRGPVRFFMCGEYGDENGRPHYHAAFFGEAFLVDRKRWRKSDTGHWLYRSESLERLWPFGASEIGNLSVQSAAYMARYSLKKVTGRLAASHYERVDVETGELVRIDPEFVRMSLRPGIGANWFDNFHRDVYPHDRVVVKGMKKRPPRYYDKRLAAMDPLLMEELKYLRAQQALEHSDDLTEERLAVKEVVEEARLATLKRSL